MALRTVPAAPPHFSNACGQCKHRGAQGKKLSFSWLHSGRFLVERLLDLGSASPGRVRSHDSAALTGECLTNRQKLAQSAFQVLQVQRIRAVRLGLRRIVMHFHKNSVDTRRHRRA